MILVLTGPECSGKSSLAAQLHAHLDWPLLPELARAYLDDRHAQSGIYCYRPSDLLNLASMQMRAEALKCNKGNAILDTDLLTIIVWWQEKFDQFLGSYRLNGNAKPRVAICCASQICPGSLTHSVKTRRIEIVYTRFMEAELSNRGCKYSICEGNEKSRLAQALTAIKSVD